MNSTNDSFGQKDNLEGKSIKSITRLFHFILDSIICLVLYLLIGHLMDTYVVRFNSYVANYIYSSLLALIVFLGYYVVLELLFRSTIAKLFTRTKVIGLNGKNPTLSQILIRSISRLIPIDPFLYLFSKQGLHDRFSKTTLIKTKRHS